MTTLYNTFEPTDASDNNYYTNYDESESSTDSGGNLNNFYDYFLKFLNVWDFVVIERIKIKIFYF